MDSYGYDAVGAAIFGIIMLIVFIFAIAGYVLTSLFLMKIFEKAGVEGKWRAWVPVYNAMIFLKLGDLSPWLILYAVGGTIVLSWIPPLASILSIAASALMVLAAYRVGQKLQKEGAWVVLYIFLSIVWLGINAFDKSRWNKQIPPAPWAANAFFGDRTDWVAVPAQSSGHVPPVYGAAPQGYGSASGYQPPAAPGYQPPAAPGYQPPAPGYQHPGAAPAVPPVAPPPAAPNQSPAAPTPPAQPPTAPPVPPAPRTDPTQPPA